VSQAARLKRGRRIEFVSLKTPSFCINEEKRDKKEVKSRNEEVEAIVSF
jgi:hypothetical protein